MSSYTKTVNFAVKDGLSSGDPAKIVHGTELNTEFDNIATAVATKQDSLPVSDATAIVFNSSDSTKRVRLLASGLTTGTTRVLTVQDADGTIAFSTQATFTATVSVVTPLVVAAAAATLRLGSNNAASWQFNATGPNRFEPIGDNTDELGNAAARIAKIFTGIIDSGTAGSLSLKTANGTTGFEVLHVAGANHITISSGTLSLLSTSAGGLIVSSGGASDIFFNTNQVSSAETQFQVVRTAGSSRNITVTGSNGGNPTISTTAGSLAITPSVVVAGTTLQVGTNPSANPGFNIPYSGSAYSSRNSANNADLTLIFAQTVNTSIDVITVGQSGSGGVILQGRSKAAAPTTSDIPSGSWAVWRDTSGATTKLYYNNAGSIQSVALA